MKDELWAGLLTVALVVGLAVISIFGPSSPLVF